MKFQSRWWFRYSLEKDSRHHARRVLENEFIFPFFSLLLEKYFSAQILFTSKHEQRSMKFMFVFNREKFTLLSREKLEFEGKSEIKPLLLRCANIYQHAAWRWEMKWGSKHNDEGRRRAREIERRKLSNIFSVIHFYDATDFHPR